LPPRCCSTAQRRNRDNGEYVRAFRDPRTVHATCEDYRAAATIDLAHDRRDRRRKLAMPVLVVWGRYGVIERLFDPLRDWREVAQRVAGRALACGHFIPEEAPRQLLAELRRFLGRHQKRAKKA